MCSALSFSEASRRSASPAPGLVVPAIGFSEARVPSSLTSVSGEDPTSEIPSSSSRKWYGRRVDAPERAVERERGDARSAAPPAARGRSGRRRRRGCAPSPAALPPRRPPGRESAASGRGRPRARGRPSPRRRAAPRPRRGRRRAPRPRSRRGRSGRACRRRRSGSRAGRARAPGAARSARARRRGRSRGSRRPGARRDLALGVGEVHQARPGPDEAVPPQPPLLHRLEQEAGARPGAQAEVGPERGDQVGVDVGCVCHGKRKDPPGGGLRAERAVRVPLG